MANRLVCLEGTVDFEEEIRNQAVKYHLIPPGAANHD
ncbi:Uncharacterised protein [Raoultella planticola]|uniref:Uncharacterized protein n=1 Tax=Raoultella planticola TaxID=575 RepID=A0A485D140_RAOPL|nr:Uncharacterised protein [Raoultella planticola]